MRHHTEPNRKGDRERAGKRNISVKPFALFFCFLLSLFSQGEQIDDISKAPCLSPPLVQRKCSSPLLPLWINQNPSSLIMPQPFCCVCVWRGSGHEDLSGIAVGLIRNKGFGLGKGMIAISDGWMDGWMDRWGGIGWGEVRIALRVMQHTSLPTMIKHFASFLLFISILMRLGLFNCHSSCALNQHIRMISEGSFDTEDWSNSCWKFRFASQE